MTLLKISNELGVDRVTLKDQMKVMKILNLK